MLNIGDVLTIELKNSEELEKFKCKLLDRKGNQIFIDYPVSEKTGKIAFFIDGTEIRASFFAKDSAVYMFDSEIIGRKRENIPMLILSYPGIEKLVRIQRREYLRIEATVDLAIHPVNEEDFKPFTTMTIDISAGGAAIILPKNHNFKSQTEINCFLVLPLTNGEYFYIKTRSKVIRIIAGTNGSRDKAPIQFIDLSQNEIQQITRFCFDRQLRDRKKGL